jgi:hypothetical protein
LLLGWIRRLIGADIANASLPLVEAFDTGLDVLQLLKREHAIIVSGNFAESFGRHVFSFHDMPDIAPGWSYAYL